ncbi:WecB/TagA/CpsF family glycosyltransferase [Rhodovulum visakhapatnamense]|uniref:Exopolysaccharide biosynthesis WecB/TagA/CpsF family protein n=1 Tax=Rhodovulum visakhapatnamense TaxID=364297 RepID=A0A4V3GRL8_9RHOB|nr:WecB/TagA/CpsF family glycosyltransferase [Rhodovulum visakhapatnamense]TDX19613.1 exopolysaccharide biosynthesis WecB/TagA/CpsF family protein [Rhodovulum visakhapatnamense]
MADGTTVKEAAAARLATASRVPMLNAYVHDISMDDLVAGFTEGALLTLHVDMAMKLQQDRAFHDIVGKFDVITCDSQIMYFATKFLGTPVQERVSGSDYFPRFYMHHKDNPDITVFLMGGKPGIAEKAAANVNAKVGREMIVGCCSPAFDFETRAGETDRMIEAVNASGATVCVVGLGGGRQEKFIMRHRDRMPGVRLWLPLGGTIDYESGTFERPPSWVTEGGLEWLYRLLKEPRARFHRYVIHEPPFLWAVLKQKLGLYRDPFA